MISKISPSDIHITQNKIHECIEILKRLHENPQDFANLGDDERLELLKVTGQLSRPDRDVHRERIKAMKKEQKKKIVLSEKKARAATGIRSARDQEVFRAPLQITHSLSPQEQKLHSPRNCYVCKAEYTTLHFFYDSMCRSCGDYNYQKRFQTANLSGQTALLTGARLKIGYHVALMLLRSGAQVIATTRFPNDAARRFSQEEDFGKWKDRLQIFGLDLRHTPSVEIFCNYIIQQYPRLDILINNAAQTVRRPPGFYKHLMNGENLNFSSLNSELQTLLTDYETCKMSLQQLKISASQTPDSLSLVNPSWQNSKLGMGLTYSAQLSLIPYSHNESVDQPDIFPAGKLDADLQQVDLRKVNSWRLKIGEIDTAEMIELQLINSIAPFVLCNRLIPLMKKEKTGQKHIVNVSAMEGKFLRFKKSERHPHTNMAKAALNMMTHTAAAELAQWGIYMNAVDTGWVTDEDPIELSKQKQDVHDFQPPLDIVDGAARICDPLFDGINTGKHWSGKFLKDYSPIDW